MIWAFKMYIYVHVLFYVIYIHIYVLMQSFILFFFFNPVLHCQEAFA